MEMLALVTYQISSHRSNLTQNYFVDQRPSLTYYVLQSYKSQEEIHQLSLEPVPHISTERRVIHKIVGFEIRVNDARVLQTGMHIAGTQVRMGNKNQECVVTLVLPNAFAYLTISFPSLTSVVCHHLNIQKTTSIRQLLWCFDTS